MRSALPALLVAGLALAGCASGNASGGTSSSNDESEQIRDIAVNVLTLQQGTISGLREKTGTGPFTVYALPPDEMLDVLKEAALRARREPGHLHVKVYVSSHYREVVVKEFEKAHPSYKDPFRSAGLATVHPVEGRPDASRVEIHGTQRGPFHQGTIAWERRWPEWIRQELARRAGTIRGGV